MNAEKPYVAIAPMMDWTDRHCRYFHRLLAPNVHLFTEMVTTGALIHGDRERFLRFDAAEHPVTLQLGGSDPAALALCARMGEDHGYDEINLNCGCPSDRVQSGAFGACLMKEPQQVADCVGAMIDAVHIPVSVKCRIGVDDCDDFSFLNKFIEEVSKVGCQIFTIHARKAWLHGLSPKENREVPPLRYDIVSQIKEKHPDLKIYVNGGIKTIEQIQEYLSAFDGVMIGREAYQNPYFLTEIGRTVFGNGNILPRETVAQAMIPYIEKQARLYDTPAKSITRHMIGLYHGQPGGRKWRRALSEQRPVQEALASIPQRFQAESA
ncbi:MAG: tRNA dihydrouridine(20/20a) synthase DusA [Rhodospirillales bacterium]|nr:tRNA dihydrouridine(20/20a) synthase DusA [Rhodospirillales bacterium]MCB9995812.1 tRNA dihydrouridine(20/20a) synthase DusA [Rhodospirillales bacterium]